MKGVEIVGREPVPGRLDWVRLRLDDGTSLDIRVKDWVECGLRLGDALTPETHAELLRRAARAEARETALRFLRTRLRTVAEVRRRLSRAGLAESVVEDVIAELEQEGWLNDDTYVTEYIASEQPRRSRLEIRWRLAKRGIPEDRVRFRLNSEEAQQAEMQALRDIAEKYWRSHAGDPVDQRCRRLAQYLMRRGFPRGPVLRVVRQLADGEDTGRELDETSP